jgi:hypothetical protein
MILSKTLAALALVKNLLSVAIKKSTPSNSNSTGRSKTYATLAAYTTVTNGLFIIIIVISVYKCI